MEILLGSQMDYFNTLKTFIMQIVLRYIRLYGVSRTFIKVRGQQHMKGSYHFEGKSWINSNAKNKGDVAVVGLSDDT